MTTAMLSDPDAASVRRAILGVSGVFLVNGTLVGSLATHFAALKERLDIAPQVFSLILISMAMGSIIAMGLSSLPVRRFGSAPVLTVVAVATPLLFILPILAGSPALAAVAIFALGAANGLMDTSMNVQAATAERRSGRLVMTRIHAMYSVGGIVGAISTGYALDRMSAQLHAGILAAVCVAAIAVFARMLLPAAADRGVRGSTLALPSLRLLPVAAMAFLVLFCGGALRDWSSVYLLEKYHTDYATASWGFAAFSGATAIMRLFGDAIRHAFGDRLVLITGGLAGAAALAAGLLATTPLGTILAMSVLGVAHATLTPLLFSVAGQIDGKAAAANMSAVMTIGFTGYIAGPPLIGFVAAQSSLGVGMFSAVIASALVAVVAFARRN